MIIIGFLVLCMVLILSNVPSKEDLYKNGELNKVTEYRWQPAKVRRCSGYRYSRHSKYVRNENFKGEPLMPNFTLIVSIIVIGMFAILVAYAQDIYFDYQRHQENIRVMQEL